MELSLTDDMLIKLWDWEKKWSCSQVFEGHTHYVMQIVINPKDNNQFASASLDRTIKVETVLMLFIFSLKCITLYTLLQSCIFINQKNNQFYCRHTFFPST